MNKPNPLPIHRGQQAPVRSSVVEKRKENKHKREVVSIMITGYEKLQENNEHGNTATELKYLSRQPTTGELNASSVQLQTKETRKIDYR